ncbi:apolipoprotein N-acyltransferase [Phaeobacter inhibens]|uniref:apolipoprotein N-acyltransferase n=1 Tax=Phaeobacter inhibens TaxID=221822 RepID=UPI000C9CE146|nr:apolipoprotein N-acyltransferase [Phaeobacter inhibens]AUQ61439.1 apolipoprotein N-acyltransferase Int [Phaeobacter inhibens]AUQ81406.1 apolipoprotein N-acyltransferase Int [Phaeobacter inhibens]AUQ89069.1 apolipoprotein N-acyltransferase Int [Phaeobacter inhibens]MDO6756319.1 apolipoprotein N-acyltransferase [Phaeobacter inhibens]
MITKAWSATSLRSAFLSVATAVAAGGLLAFALAPFHVLWLVPLCLGVVGYQLLQVSSIRRGALFGWLLGTAYFSVGMIWIYEPFQVDADRYAWMAPFAVVGLAGGLALFWALAFGVAVRFGQGATRLPLFIALLSLGEFARAYVLTGLPWAAFGQFWIDTPAAQLLPWIGPHGLGFLTLSATVPLGLIRHRPVAALLPLIAVGAVVVLLPKPPVAALTEHTLRLVQPNAPQDQKWHPDLRWSFVERQLEYSRAPAADGSAVDLILWPETAIPLMLNYAEDVLDEVASAAGDTPVMLGIQRRTDGQYHNSAIVLQGSNVPAQIYDKAHLVPFGEYIPAGNLMARFGVHGFASQAGAGYAAGPGPRLLDLPVGKALPLICYEAVFPQDVNAAPGRADLLIQITNDAWFGTYSGPYQHLVQARMRAIEQGLPMARVANTGISAMIDPYGRILDALPLGVAGYLDVALPAPLPRTLYARTGDLPVFLFCIVLGGLALRRSTTLARGS